MLDLCCYTGGFSIYAAKGGATEVIGMLLQIIQIVYILNNFLKIYTRC